MWAVIETSLFALDPRFQSIARSWLEIVTEHVMRVRYPGHTVRVIETRRQRARQQTVFDAGGSTLKVGYHNFGLAMDFAVFAPNGTYEKTDESGAYRACGFIAMGLGMRWGGNWDGDNTIKEPGENDLGHLEFRPPGVTLARLMEGAGMSSS
jgi:hypothetical protein